MIFPFRFIARRKELAKLSGAERGGALPLSAVSSVVVYLDRDMPDWAACERKIRGYFEEKGIEMHSVVLNPFDVDGLGRRLKTPRDPKGLGKEDLLVSLVPQSSFTLSYEVLSSEAKFKIGLVEPKKLKLYDMVVRDSSGEKKTPFEMIDSITAMLELIR